MDPAIFRHVRRPFELRREIISRTVRGMFACLPTLAEQERSFAPLRMTILSGSPGRLCFPRKAHPVGSLFAEERPDGRFGIESALTGVPPPFYARISFQGGYFLNRTRISF